MRGTPVLPGIASKPSHLPLPDWAKRVETPSCASPSTLMPQALASCQAWKLMTVRANENKTSGGSSETELNELTVVPCNSPSAPRAVTTATPVGKTSRVFLNSPEVKAMVVLSKLLSRELRSLPCRVDDVRKGIGRQQVVYHAARRAPIEGAI